MLLRRFKNNNLVRRRFPITFLGNDNLIKTGPSRGGGKYKMPFATSPGKIEDWLICQI